MSDISTYELYRDVVAALLIRICELNL